MVRIERKKPASLKGVESLYKGKGVGSLIYSSVELYKTGNECWLFFRSRVAKRKPSLWVEVSSLQGKGLWDCYQEFAKFTNNDSLEDAISLFQGVGLDSREFYEIMNIEWGLHKKILRKPGYTLFDPA